MPPTPAPPAWRVLHHADYPVVRWRNGHGAARSIADGDGWQLRLADIEASCPFSDYPGTRRLFAMVDGSVLLRFGSGYEVTCDPAGPVESFDGVPAPDCQLLSGAPARALNLMVDPGKVVGTMERLRIDREATLLPAMDMDGGRTVAVFVQQGLIVVHEDAPREASMAAAARTSTGQRNVDPPATSMISQPLAPWDAILATGGPRTSRFLSIASADGAPVVVLVARVRRKTDLP